MPTGITGPGQSATVTAPAAIGQAFKLVKEFEGLRLTAYMDAGSYSIGYGCKYIDGKKVYAGQAITAAQAQTAAFAALNVFYKDLKKYITPSLNTAQWAALLDLAYANPTVLKKSHLVALINSKAPAAEVQAEWIKTLVKSEGVLVDGLVKRRVKEAFLFTGIEKFPGENSAPIVSGFSNRFAILAAAAIVAIFFIYKHFKK